MDIKIVGQQKDNREFFMDKIYPCIERFKLKDNANKDAVFCLHTCILDVNEKTGMVESQTQGAFNGTEDGMFYGMVEVANSVPVFMTALLRAATHILNENKTEGDPRIEALTEACKAAGIELEFIGTVSSPIDFTHDPFCECEECRIKKSN